MIDNDLKVHVLEVNGRPQLQSHVLDKAVNRPMLAEMLKIIGYHIPRSQNQSKREFISGKFDLGPDYGQNGNASKYPVDHEFLVYSRVLIQNDVIKQKLPAFQDSSINRDDYLETILKDLSPMDVRTLVKSEEEFSQTNNFTRIFPRANSHIYFKYFYAGILTMTNCWTLGNTTMETIVAKELKNLENIVRKLFIYKNTYKFIF